MPQLYWLICIAQHKLGRTTLKHIKSFLSAVFSYAKNQGVLDGVNPIQDAMIPKKAPAPPDTHAATLEEGMRGSGVDVFVGLRPGEARGVCWGITTANRFLSVSPCGIPALQGQK